MNIAVEEMKNNKSGTIETENNFSIAVEEKTNNETIEKSENVMETINENNKL